MTGEDMIIEAAAKLLDDKNFQKFVHQLTNRETLERVSRLRVTFIIAGRCQKCGDGVDEDTKRCFRDHVQPPDPVIDQLRGVVRPLPFSVVVDDIGDTPKLDKLMEPGAIPKWFRELSEFENDSGDPDQSSIFESAAEYVEHLEKPPTLSHEIIDLKLDQIEEAPELPFLLNRWELTYRSMPLPDGAGWWVVSVGADGRFLLARRKPAEEPK